MVSRVLIAFVLSALAAPLTAQSGSIRASATVLSGPAVVQQAPAVHLLTERISASLGVRIVERSDASPAGLDPQMVLAAFAPWHVRAIRELDPGATPNDGSELRADTDGLTAWAWVEGSEDVTAHMIIADLTR